ncbi:MAG TPA: hypothetical protein VNU74_10240 [Terriglobales bacterium]|jgi:hypothetical protein|nr:hypothetical protein [Terriglobales bacterium]
MKKVCTLAVAIILLSIEAFATPFGQGSVVFVLALPGPGNFRAFDFNLCCGGPAGLGFLGNGFDYEGAVGGVFNLAYTADGICANGCTFTGNFQTFDPPQHVDQFCYVQNGTLIGTFVVGTDPNDQIKAEYSQTICLEKGVYWSSTGGLTVHWEQ